MESKLRQMTLEEIEQAHQKIVGDEWRVRVSNKENGHVQIRTERKTA